MTEIITRNRPAQTVLKEFVERQKGKVVDARKELQRRFTGLDWNIQKKVLIAHLMSSKSDRQWAYPHLLTHWDKCFMPYVQEIWETYQEERCSWVIVRHFPKEYILNNLHLFTFERNYYYISLRFGMNPDFTIDPTKLTPIEFLSIHYRLNKSIPAEQANTLLCQIVTEAIANYRITDLEVEPLEQGRITSLYPQRVKNFQRALYYITKMDIQPTASHIAQKCQLVAEIMNHSPEWEHLQTQVINDWDFNQKAYRIVLKYMAMHFPNSIIQEQLNQHPQLKELANNLHLAFNFDYILNE